MMGRPPTPTETLKLHGNYRKDRHADRADVVPPGGNPKRPKDLSAIEAALWDQVVPDLIRRKLVGESDTAELVLLCEMWGLYRASVALAKVSPTDKEVRCAVTAYATTFDRIASKFGMSSVDLARLKVPRSDKPKSISTRNRA